MRRVSNPIVLVFFLVLVVFLVLVLVIEPGIAPERIDYEDEDDDEDEMKF